MKKIGVFLVVLSFCFLGTAGADTFQLGGDRLASLQNTDGGWDWPLDNGDPATGSATNTAAPIGMGLIAA